MADIQRVLLPEEPGAQYYGMDVDDSVPELDEGRPAPLGEPRPQAGFVRHTEVRLRAGARTRGAAAGGANWTSRSLTSQFVLVGSV